MAFFKVMLVLLPLSFGLQTQPTFSHSRTRHLEDETTHRSRFDEKPLIVDSERRMTTTFDAKIRSKAVGSESLERTEKELENLFRSNSEMITNRRGVPQHARWEDSLRQEAVNSDLRREERLVREKIVLMPDKNETRDDKTFRKMSVEKAWILDPKGDTTKTVRESMMNRDKVDAKIETLSLTLRLTSSNFKLYKAVEWVIAEMPKLIKLDLACGIPPQIHENPRMTVKLLRKIDGKLETTIERHGEKCKAISGTLWRLGLKLWKIREKPGKIDGKRIRKTGESLEIQIESQQTIAKVIGKLDEIYWELETTSKTSGWPLLRMDDENCWTGKFKGHVQKLVEQRNPKGDPRILPQISEILILDEKFEMLVKKPVKSGNTQKNHKNLPKELVILIKKTTKPGNLEETLDKFPEILEMFIKKTLRRNNPEENR
eukprot:TCALIF_06876-PA protein Name:"Protein of unknown function" AED:0.05 eAED:0.05 QI:82/0.33/0.25/1/1/1/4/0/430